MMFSIFHPLLHNSEREHREDGKFLNIVRKKVTTVLKLDCRPYLLAMTVCVLIVGWYMVLIKRFRDY